MTGLDPVLVDAGKTIGLLDSSGDLSSDWFQNPFHQLEEIFSDATQRSAMLDLIDQLWKPDTPADAPANEKWHPLLGAQTLGNLYLTVANGSGPIKLGVAGELHSTTSPLPAELRAHLPLIKVTDAGVTAIAGGEEGPFEIAVRVELGWSRAKGQAIDLKAINAKAVLAPLTTTPVSLHIILEALSLDGTAPRDTELDPAALGADAFQLVTGLLREKLRQLVAGGAAGEAGALAAHLMPLFGLADGFPSFPFATLTTDPAAFRNWIAALSAAGKMSAWLGHLGAIFGGDSVTNGSGTAADPFRVKIFSIDANSEIDATIAQVTEEHTGTARLEIGLRASYLPAGPNPAARIEASATIVSIPLAGSTTSAVLPLAAISVVAPGNPADQLVNAAGVIVAQSLRAGAQWNGTAIVPQLELDDVDLTLTGQTDHYDRIDLTHTDSVIGIASNAVADAIRKGLGAAGGGAGAHLAALAGLIAPAGDPGSPHRSRSRTWFPTRPRPLPPSTGRRCSIRCTTGHSYSRKRRHSPAWPHLCLAAALPLTPGVCCWKPAASIWRLPRGISRRPATPPIRSNYGSDCAPRPLPLRGTSRGRRNCWRLICRNPARPMFP